MSSAAISMTEREEPRVHTGWQCETVSPNSLPAARSREAFDLHQAALEWSLIEPIIIRDEGDIQAVNWKERGLDPFVHQIENLKIFCNRLPVALIADDVGLGKTISAGIILSELIARRKVMRTLIICPKVLIDQWVGELDNKFGLEAYDATGLELETVLKRANRIVVTTYESASPRLERIESAMFDLVIFDEAHKLRNLFGAKKGPPALAVNVKEFLERRPCKFVLMLTATPIQNKIWDLYSLIDLLRTAEGRVNPLGTRQAFSQAFLAPGTDGQQLQPNAKDRFQQIVRECLQRTRRRDVKLKFPERQTELVKVQLSARELELQTIVGEHIASCDALTQISLAQAMMSSPRALIGQMRNMVSNKTMDPMALQAARSAASNITRPAKLEYVLKLVEELREQRPNDWRLVIFTVRRETQDMIGEALTNDGMSVSYIRGGAASHNRTAIEQYTMQPPIVHVLVSTDAGAEGINLQAGNVLVNYDLPWNPMIVEQRIGRIQRLGSKHESVHVINLSGRDTVEVRIVARLMHKLQGVQQAIGDIDGILEAAGMADDEGQGTFESRIRKLVLQALRGQNTDEARQMLEANIEEAKQLYEALQANLKDTLGDDADGPVARPAMPRIERRAPKMPAREFVLAAKREQGYRLREVEPGFYEATAPGRVTERIAFVESMIPGENAPRFAGVAASCYLPGWQKFIELVQHWVGRDAHHITDLTATRHRDVVQIAQAWCESFPGCIYQSADYTAQEKVFHGTVALRVKAGTGVDSFEKILRGRMKPPKDHLPVIAEPTDERITTSVSVIDVLPQYDAALRAVVQKDEEIGKFCGFYLARLEESLIGTEYDPYRRAKVEGNLRPRVETEVCGIEGLRYDTGRLTIKYQIDGHDYSSVLHVIPANRELLQSPRGVLCHLSQRTWPADAVVDCTVPGRQALKHRVVTLADGRYEIPQETVTCEITRETILQCDAAASAVSGKTVRKTLLTTCVISNEFALPEELGRSDVSGRLARHEYFVASAISKRLGLPDEIVKCKPTGRMILRVEGVSSATTKDWYAHDQLVASLVSGRLAPPPDLVTCEETGDLVLRHERGVCEVTGRRVAVDRLLTSVLSGAKMDRGSAARTDDGRVALPTEIAICRWQNRRLLVPEIIACKLSGLPVARDWLNAAGELKPLRDLLDGRLAGEELDADGYQWIITQPGWKSVVNARWIRSPDSETTVFTAQARGWLSLGNKQVGGVGQITRENRRMFCAPLIGRRRKQRWERISSP